MNDTTQGVQIAREFTGGFLHGETLAMNEATVATSVPIKDRHGKTMTPPRWAEYSLETDGLMHWIGDGASLQECMTIRWQHRNRDYIRNLVQEATGRSPAALPKATRLKGGTQ